MGLYEAYLFLKHLAALQCKSAAVVPELVALGVQVQHLIQKDSLLLQEQIRQGF